MRQGLRINQPCNVLSVSECNPSYIIVAVVSVGSGRVRTQGACRGDLLVTHTHTPAHVHRDFSPLRSCTAPDSVHRNYAQDLWRQEEWLSVLPLVLAPSLSHYSETHWVCWKTLLDCLIFQKWPFTKITIATFWVSSCSQVTSHSAISDKNHIFSPYLVNNVYDCKYSPAVWQIYN